MESYRREYEFSLSSILSFVWRGIVVGCAAGIVVSLFRLLIAKIFAQVVKYYQLSHKNPSLLGLILLVSVIVVIAIGFLVKSDPDIKGSGIPHVEGELKGLLHPDWWSVLWKKFLGGTLAISMGFMLGREGPSIQLGAMAGKGVAKTLKAQRMEQRVLIASGAAAGLSAAFNAPIAGLLFVVEEIYHQFSRLVWISALVASLVANFISLNIFGLTPVLDMPGELVILPLKDYWLLLILGAFLGAMGYLYEKVTLNAGVVYDFLGKVCHIPNYFYGIFAAVLIIPIGYFFPQLLGGGNGLITSLTTSHLTLAVVFLYFIIRFIWSALSYASGLPGGIFLPILTLGALLGFGFGLGVNQLGFISTAALINFLVLGMAGYFGAISKAPLTAMILVTEMVGDFRQLMTIAVVTLVAYIVMDLLKGEPIYEAMLAKLSIPKDREVIEPTLIELTVSDKIAGKRVRDLTLPKNVLITTQIHRQKSEVVRGNTVLNAGDTIFLVVNEPEIGKIRQLLM
ncbi:ClC family H(+)/Cl(-) exchange transporter [Streptococcus equinus]|uniref:ClC family H(+)/Cl(-) exchange transporter n=1 Tax=Streptococcus equinus TaxID=1335 RepID=UPI0012F8E56F|nr:ClC family H(+)/Cl(-) exchange transporter [Streptococcus equinus]QGX47041.1 ClC family H(+)/Cl(-) exchange transporter [Streptococcus equinus]